MSALVRNNNNARSFIEYIIAKNIYSALRIYSVRRGGGFGAQSQDEFPPLIIFPQGEGKKISAWRLFNYTNLHAEPPFRNVRILSGTRKSSSRVVAAGRAAVARELSLFPRGPSALLPSWFERRAICLFSARRLQSSALRSATPFPVPPSPCSLTLISWMRYNREHNLEIEGNNFCNGVNQSVWRARSLARTRVRAAQSASKLRHLQLVVSAA